MTGVEAVSNGVMAFRDPTRKNAKITLTIIIVLLAILLLGIALLCRAYGIAATDAGLPGYESVLSMLTRAVMGHGWFYSSLSLQCCWCWPSRPTPRLPIFRG